MTALHLPVHIDRLLLLAAEASCGAVLDLGGRRHLGRLDLPDDFGECAFVVEEGPPASVPAGHPAQVELWIRGELTRFRTRVRSGRGRRIRLDRPRRVDRMARVLPFGTAFALAFGGEVRWHAVSSLEADELHFIVGQHLPPGTVEGWLAMPGRGVMPVRLMNHVDGAMRVGCIRGSRPVDRQHLRSRPAQARAS